MTIQQNSVGAQFLETFVPGTTINRIPPFRVGTRMKGNNGAEWMFVQFGGAVTGPGFVCQIDENFSAVMVSTANDAGGDMIGVASVAHASGSFGWLQVLGPCQVQVAASAAANVRLNTTATAGQIDDDGTAGSFAILGLVLTTARAASAGLAPGLLSYPTQAQAAL